MCELLYLTQVAVDD